MGNGEVVEVMTIGSTSIEECGGREFVAIRFMNPKITKNQKEHVIFEDMLHLVDFWDPLQEEDSGNQGESQSSSNNDNEEEIEASAS